MPQDTVTTKTATRADEVRRVIEEEIFLGKLRPGSRLDEETLAQRFNISRTPVREAILQLVSTGLVEKRPRQGAVVAPLNLHRMVQMFEVMSESEGLCCKYAARRMSAEEKERLKEIHEASKRHMENHELDAYYALNRQFHEAIHQGSHNEVLEEIVRGLFARLAPYRRYQLNHPTRVGESFDEHDAVVRAILASDPANAYHAMRKHVTIQADIFAEFVSIMGGASMQDMR
ncbi:MAG TPA: GntR family transcriptional regulator [Azospirillaceae bacterium]|nr:GntR family transcriptional regulator [Azospirillaceae bacterium]